MRTKSPRILIASIALTLVGFAGFTAPAEAAPVQSQRTVWCC